MTEPTPTLFVQVSASCQADLALPSAFGPGIQAATFVFLQGWGSSRIRGLPSGGSVQGPKAAEGNDERTQGREPMGGCQRC